MSKFLLKVSIERKTRRCLREGRNQSLRSRWMPGLSQNFLFSLIAVALMGTVVHGVYQMPVSSSLRTKIQAGEAIPDREVPVVAEARAMRLAALDEIGKLKLNQQIKSFALRFGINNRLSSLIYNISEDENIDPELIYRIIWAESRFKSDCIGSVGEIGLMQVRYGTALSIDPGATPRKLYDPAYNIRIGIKHLKDHLHFYRGDRRLALLAYNRGRGKVNELVNLGVNPSNGYASKVLESNF